MDFYEVVAEYNSVSTFYIPVALAMIMSGVNHKDAYSDVHRICLKIGTYFEAQEDYLDVFGLQENKDRLGTSIAIGKYTWPIVIAIGRSNSLHYNMLMDNYGRNDTFKICVVKTIFERLHIQSFYGDYEYDVRKKISSEIGHLPEEITNKLFKTIMRALLNRWPGSYESH
ncbi:unnamed protein product [Allacma fusca]|uniref:Farnesyl pyrophosphate synthase n=1 Tax=Allacma fusca TaxID=39272 RepID=A0A8J2KXC7_9HEXA|nr:unnamed protein product [Allacma fusca]